jgi:3-hydroxyisobutyrate dehydrogenase-like beta-hydroxyacid dehydrogenase
MKLGFIGLGKMGAAMAQNLLPACEQLTVFNRSREKGEALARKGARVADSPAEAARNADAVFTMMPDDSAVEQVTFGEAGILAGLGEGATHISSSTISIKAAKRLAEEHERTHRNFLSAAVFGRPQAAEARQLLVIAAGKNQLIEKYRPAFDAIGRRTFVIGPEPWQANLFKLLGNFMIATVLETFGEAFATVRKAGVDHQAFLEVMGELFGSPVYKNYGQAIADQRFTPAGFALNLGLKDVRLALEAAAEFNSALPIGSVLRDHFISALAHGQEQMDWSSVALVSSRNSGLDHPARAIAAHLSE